MTSKPVIGLIRELVISNLFTVFFIVYLCLQYKVVNFFVVIQQIPVKNFKWTVNEC